MWILCILWKDIFITKTRRLENTKILLVFFRAFVISCFRDWSFFGSGLSGLGGIRSKTRLTRFRSHHFGYVLCLISQSWLMPHLDAYLFNNKSKHKSTVWYTKGSRILNLFAKGNRHGLYWTNLRFFSRWGVGVVRIAAFSDPAPRVGGALAATLFYGTESAARQE